MVASRDGDLYTPFPQTMIVEEGPQSSEEGSGLHSPIFGPPFPQPHGDSSLRYHPDHLDIQSASILNPQYAYNCLDMHEGPILLDTTLNGHTNGSNHANHHADFSLPPRNHLGLDISSHPLSNTRLPPPSQDGQVDMDYRMSSERRYHGEQPHEIGYASIGEATSGMPMDISQRSTSNTTNNTASRRDSAPSQTGTTAHEPRREASSVVIACRQCRARKIRCDSTRPVCNNCLRRSNDCQYDAVPKRRGPDKRPGTRQRSCKKRPAEGAPQPPSKRKKIDPAADPQRPSSAFERDNMSDQDHSASSRPSNLHERGHGQIHLQQSSLSPQADGFSPSSRSRGLSTGEGVFSTHSDQEETKPRIPSSPSVHYSRKIWWDDLVNSYSATRDQSLKDIAADLSFLFTSSGYWLCFVNIPDFIRSVYNPEDRSHMQPSLVLSGLAMANLMKSSDIEMGAPGRSRAIVLRDLAQGSLEASFNSHAIDPTLAKAALILALFESSAHPQYSPARAESSLGFLDSIIRALSLTIIDANRPDISIYVQHAVPVATHHQSPDLISKNRALQNPRKCSCIQFPLNAALSAEHFSSSWSYIPPWDPEWTTMEMHQEASRRLCWSALNLVASHTSCCIVSRREPADFFLTNPANYALYFPGEISDRASQTRHSQSPKDSVWALYCRSMLLWTFCVRLRKDTCSDEEKAELALEAWGETNAIQDAVDAHICNLDTALLYMCREYIYNSQMMIAQILRSLQGLDSGYGPPSFNRKQAEEWLYYQDQVIKRVKISIHHLGDSDGHLLTRRPFQINWFVSQLGICLSLWDNDPSLIHALDLAKSILVPVDVLNALWPCEGQQRKCDELRDRLSEACIATRTAPPAPANYILPHIRAE